MGVIGVLGGKRIVLHGQKDVACKIDVAASGILRGFRVGDQARVTCLNGLLTAIVRAQGASTPGSSSSTSSSSSSVSSSASVTTSTSTATGGTTTQSLSAGIGTIAALGGGSITVGPISCTIGAGSPETSGFEIGDRVSLRCANGGLTALSHAS